MPVIFNQYQNTFRLALWSLNEPLSFFEEKTQLSAADKIKYSKIKNETRKKEWLAVRLLLHDTLGFWPQITYTETGKPLLQNHSRHLSISHSKSMVGILLCTSTHSGIDIEPLNRSIDKVAFRFLSEQEQQYIDSHPMKYSRIIYWCAKEAIFKAVNESNILFSKQIFITEVTDMGTMQGTFTSPKEQVNFNLNYIELEEHIIVWTT
jgi:4'-phosphopantetheinyl transferase